MTVKPEDHHPMSNFRAKELSWYYEITQFHANSFTDKLENNESAYNSLEKS